MPDPLGLLGYAAGLNRTGPMVPLRGGSEGPAADAPAGGFKQMLQDQIDQVNELQNDAKHAMEDLAAGRRDDVDSVMTATLKADMAFRMLLQVRNKVMDAYEEVKQLRI